MVVKDIGEGLVGCLQHSLWRRTNAGPWLHEEGILLSQARAAVQDCEENRQESTTSQKASCSHVCLKQSPLERVRMGWRQPMGPKRCAAFAPTSTLKRSKLETQTCRQKRPGFRGVLLCY